LISLSSNDPNIKLAGVASNLVGVSGRAMLAALLDGTTDPAALAELALGKLRKKRQALARALSGRFSDHHRLLLTTHLAHIDFLDEEIDQPSTAIAERLRPFEEELNRLDTIPGVDRRTAEVLLAEIGADIGAHLVMTWGTHSGHSFDGFLLRERAVFALRSPLGADVLRTAVAA